MRISPKYCSLLKPGSDRRAHVVLRGKAAGVLEAGEYATGRAHLAESAYADACRPGNPRDTSVDEIKELYRSMM